MYAANTPGGGEKPEPPFMSIVRFMTWPEEFPPAGLWLAAAGAIKRLIPRNIIRRKGIQEIDDEVINDILVELCKERRGIKDWSGLSADFFGTQSNDDLRRRVMRIMERVLDRWRPSRRARETSLAFEPPSHRDDDIDAAIEQVMGSLTQIQRSVFERIHFSGESLRTTAKGLGISVELARQIHLDAIKKIEYMIFI